MGNCRLRTEAIPEQWNDSDILKAARKYREVPYTTSFMRLETHHQHERSLSENAMMAGANLPEHKERLDLCANVAVGNRVFLPLVRDSFALRCGLKIKFLRKEEPGDFIYQGGDIDNRLKTLFDALAVPNVDQLVNEPGVTCVSDPIHCLLEDDRLISSVEVETQKLLSRPGASKNEVRLIIDVDVRVIHAKSYNLIFLGD